ncbi:hypothetical protein SAMN04488078_105124 [Antarctobacter heliothermus]|uniref:Uncharacterized protein n=1 Tax=Antarctobacter heliothermus TaxID=74033 RepID=A0A239JEL8_9RHOB|nr:hypothetical protein SAMN04488078_105124 [Antarctobacter heliothermus]
MALPNTPDDKGLSRYRVAHPDAEVPEIAGDASFVSHLGRRHPSV